MSWIADVSVPCVDTRVRVIKTKLVGYRVLELPFHFLKTGAAAAAAVG